MDGSEDAFGEFEVADEVAVPVAAGGVEEAGGAALAVLGDGLAGEEEGEEFGHHEHACGAVEEVGAFHLLGDELEDGVEGELLHAGSRVEAVLGDAAIDLGHGFLVAGVAIGEGEVEEVAFGVDESVVDAPGVDADAVEFAGSGDAGLDLPEEFVDVPAFGAADVRHGVLEAVGLLEGEAAGVDGADHGAAARGADVDGEESHGESSVRGVRRCGGSIPRGAGGCQGEGGAGVSGGGGG